ncbi:hypothetical protein BC831DRAFT_410899 [Entophlyctis helioformis]|nr:hypothetical protein BC831DRAFT_410899 [Entophlyctis helioformis]
MALDAQLRQAHRLDIVQFARWFRVLVRTGLWSESTSIPLFEQALALIKSTRQTATPYPTDEIKWLMATAWNTGCEQWSVHHWQGAQKWCEMALSLSLYLPASDADPGTLAHMRTAYQALIDEQQQQQQLSHLLPK